MLYSARFVIISTRFCGAWRLFTLSTWSEKATLSFPLLFEHSSFSMLAFWPRCR